MGTPMPKVKIPTPAAGSLRLLAASAAGVGSLYTLYKYGLYNGTLAVPRGLAVPAASPAATVAAL